MSGAKLGLPSTRLQYSGMGSSNFTFYKVVVAYGVFTSKLTLEHIVEAQSGSGGIAPVFLVEYAAISCVMLLRLIVEYAAISCIMLLRLIVEYAAISCVMLLRPIVEYAAISCVMLLRFSC